MRPLDNFLMINQTYTKYLIERFICESLNISNNFFKLSSFDYHNILCILSSIEDSSVNADVIYLSIGDSLATPNFSLYQTQYYIECISWSKNYQCSSAY